MVGKGYRYRVDEISPSQARNDGGTPVGDAAQEDGDEEWEDEDSSEGEVDYEIYSKII